MVIAKYIAPPEKLSLALVNESNLIVFFFDHDNI